jgi:acetyl-CoA C-acetyltransferase
MARALIAGAVRTPIGRFLGGLKGFSATQLGAIVVGETLRRAGIPPPHRGGSDYG